MKKPITWLLVFTLLISLIPALIPTVKASSSWYVATTGSDAAAGDIGHPFKSIQKAVNVSMAGDTIYVRAGTYNEKICFRRSGSLGSPITLRSYPGETVIVDAGGKTVGAWDAAILIGQSESHPEIGYSYITIYGLTVRDSSGRGIYCNATNATHITIDHCTIYNIATQGILMANDFSAYGSRVNRLHNVTISNCTLYNINTTGSEDLTLYNVVDFEVSYNYLHHGKYIYIDINNNSANGKVHHNIVNGTIPTSAPNFAARVAIYIEARTGYLNNVSVYDNIVYGDSTGIGICAEFISGSTHNVSIYNNVLNITPTTAINGIRLNYPSIHDNITIKYNTVCMNDNFGYGSCVGVAGAASAYRNIVIANNILYKKGTGGWNTVFSSINWANTVINLTGNIFNTSGGIPSISWNNGTNGAKFKNPNRVINTYILTNPLFKNSAIGDFHLNESSPAIDAAISEYFVPTDFDGVPRPQGISYDIGANEYEEQGSGDSTPPVISLVGVVASSPFDTLAGYGWENFTCVVTDNVGVSNVLIKFTNPDQSTTNVPMIKKTGTTTYYMNQSLQQQGNYSYYIQAIDTSNNVALSSIHIFSLPPNWDINNDGTVTILDLTLVSNHYDETGSHGWIREDVDNNGVIQILDIVYVSSHFGESWWI
jgi:hypothetical protein